MRTGLIEPLVAAGGQLQPGELARLRTLPAGAAMLPALIWQDQAGTVGLLDVVDFSGPVTVVHPFALAGPCTASTTTIRRPARLALG